MDLSPLRIGELMVDARVCDKRPLGPRGPRVWLGSMAEVERRIEDVTKRRAEAQAALDEVS